MALLTPRTYRSAFAAALIFSTAATASFVNTSPLIASSRSSRNVDNGYAGLKWTLGESFIPELVVGFRHANVGSNGETYGGDISFSFRVWGGLQPGQIRLKYFNGADYLQGEVGGGYDFKTASSSVSAAKPHFPASAWITNLAARCRWYPISCWILSANTASRRSISESPVRYQANITIR